MSFTEHVKNKYGLNDENGLEENYWDILVENKDGRSRNYAYVFLDSQLATDSLN